MTEHPLYEEKELINRVAAGDEAAYKIIFRHYWPRIYSAALVFTKVPEIAEDAAQEVFARLWVKRAILRDVQDFRAYLFITTKNLILNKLRTQVFTGTFDEYLKEYFADALASPAAQLELKEVSATIEAAISKLTPQQEKVFRMSRFQGLTHLQIAEATGLAPRTVKNYMIEALASLRKNLDHSASSHLIYVWLLLYV